MAEAGSTQEVDNTPLPVTGLLVYPPVVPTSVHLEYSQDPNLKLNGNADIQTDYKPSATAR